MVNHTCQICNFNTERKSTYDAHLKSSKHLEKMNGNNISTSQTGSVLSAVTNDNNNTGNNTEQVEELKKQLLLKEMEIQRITNEFTFKLQMKEMEIQRITNEFNLKLQMKDMELKSKNEIIHIPQHKAPETQIENIVVKSIPQLEPFEENISEVTDELQTEIKKLKMPIKDCLKKYRADAPTIEICSKELLQDGTYNPYIINMDINGKIINLLSKEDINLDYIKDNNVVDNAIHIIKRFFNKFETAKLPFYCSDKRRNTLYIKTNDGWIRQKDENDTQFNNYLLQLAQDALYFVSKTENNTVMQFNNERVEFTEMYKTNYTDWQRNSCNRITALMLCEKDEKIKIVKDLKILLNKISRPFPEE